MHRDVVTPSLQLLGAMGKRPLVGAQIRTSLLNLLGVLFTTLTRVGHSLLSKEGSSSNNGRELHDEWLAWEMTRKRQRAAAKLGLTEEVIE